MTSNTSAFDQWIRGEFVELNTELEDTYFAQADKAAVESVGDDVKQVLVDTGRKYVVSLLAEGNTDEGFDEGFEVLGNVGLYMAACRRHDVTEPSRETTSPLTDTE